MPAIPHLAWPMGSIRINAETPTPPLTGQETKEDIGSVGHKVLDRIGRAFQHFKSLYTTNMILEPPNLILFSRDKSPLTHWCPALHHRPTKMNLAQAHKNSFMNPIHMQNLVHMSNLVHRLKNPKP